jgi:hypothetical protein
VLVVINPLSLFSFFVVSVLFGCCCLGFRVLLFVVSGELCVGSYFLVLLFRESCVFILVPHFQKSRERSDDYRDDIVFLFAEYDTFLFFWSNILHNVFSCQ